MRSNFETLRGEQRGIVLSYTLLRCRIYFDTYSTGCTERDILSKGVSCSDLQLEKFSRFLIVTEAKTPSWPCGFLPQDEGKDKGFFFKSQTYIPTKSLNWFSIPIKALRWSRFNS